MVKIRLLRMGKRHSPFYRIVVIDSHSKRDGKYIEEIGIYNPLRKEETRLSLERVSYWIERGAKPTETVTRLIKDWERRSHGSKRADSVDGKGTG
ncbi:30S ribosomal protein S16 [candidate division WOR-3 bacterium]|nr:30S ribosomal protein S16 [candidate division WOR-3 bacterium]